MGILLFTGGGLVLGMDVGISGLRFCCGLTGRFYFKVVFACSFTCVGGIVDLAFLVGACDWFLLLVACGLRLIWFLVVCACVWFACCFSDL